jgi:hypothetical protein
MGEIQDWFCRDRLIAGALKNGAGRVLLLRSRVEDTIAKTIATLNIDQVFRRLHCHYMAVPARFPDCKKDASETMNGW